MSPLTGNVPRPTVMRDRDGVTIFDYARSTSLNTEMADKHWALRARRRENDRHRWGWLIRMAQIKPVAAARLTFTAGYKRQAQDPGNCFPTAKAAVDALVDMGVLADDSAEYVRLLSFTVDRESTTDYLALRIEAAE